MSINRQRFNAEGHEDYTASKLFEISQMFSQGQLIGLISTIYPLPSHMGVWIMKDVAKTGPFFMWAGERLASGVKVENGIWGTIEDEAGSALFEGIMDEQRLNFVKNYNEKPNDPITYHSLEKRDGIYLGNYRFGLGNGTPDGFFVLEKYKPSETINAIVANIMQRNLRAI